MIPQSLSDNIAYLIGDIEHRAYLQITQIFRENKVIPTIEQFTVLSVLWYQDGLKQQELAERLNRDKTTITRVISNMVKQNLVVKVPDKTDGRAYMIYLTHFGRQLQEKLMLITGPVYMKMINGLKAEELGNAINVLNKILINLKNQ
jgi:DNA-binding MarR family transcriptional regulator